MKTCLSCGVSKIETDFYARYPKGILRGWKNVCRSCRNQALRRRYHGDAMFRQEVKDHVNTYNNWMDVTTKRTLFDILGRKCVRCGFTDMRALQFDHVNGDGSKERELMGYRQMIKYYVSHPSEAKVRLQVLCCNCNWIKRVERDECSRSYVPKRPRQ